MLELTRQEKLVIIFLIVTALIGISILCYKNLIYQPNIKIASIPITEKEIKESKVININTASVEGLIRLKGVGNVLAKEIIGYRASQGPFKNIEEIKKVKGIGQAKFDAIKDNIKTE